MALLKSARQPQLQPRQAMAGKWMDKAFDVVQETFDNMVSHPMMNQNVAGSSAVARNHAVRAVSIASVDPSPTETILAVSQTTTSAVTALLDSTSSPSAGPVVNEKRTDTLAIILGIVFGIVGLLFIFLVAFLCLRRRRKHGSFIYNDNVSEASIDSFVGTATTGVSTAKDVTPTGSSSPEHTSAIPFPEAFDGKEKTSTTPGPTNIVGRTNSFRSQRDRSPPKEPFPPFYPPLPAAHQISSLGQRRSTEYTNDYAYVPNDPFDDTNQAIYNQHLQHVHQQHQHQQLNRSRSRSSTQGANPGTPLEPLREYPEHSAFKEPRNPSPRDQAQSSLYNNYRNSHGGRSSPRSNNPHRGTMPAVYATYAPQGQQPWPPRPAHQHALTPQHMSQSIIQQSLLQRQLSQPKPTWHHAPSFPYPYPSQHAPAKGLAISFTSSPPKPSRPSRAPELSHYKRAARRWTSEPYLLPHQKAHKEFFRKPVPLPSSSSPVIPLEKVKLPAFWWESRHADLKISMLDMEDLMARCGERPLRRFSFESRPTMV